MEGQLPEKMGCLLKELPPVDEKSLVPVAPQTIPHTCVRDAVVDGYVIPAQSLVFGNLFSIHHDENYWKDPEEFRIGRWFDNNGNLINHGNHFLAFSTG